jgi:hypothetical protein
LFFQMKKCSAVTAAAAMSSRDCQGVRTMVARLGENTGEYRS